MSEVRKTTKFLKILFSEIKSQKKWVLLPLWIILVGLVAMFFLAGTSYVLPAVYIGF